MDLLKKIRAFEHIDYLIRTKSTGTPKQLATRLNISERKVFRLLSDLKTIGFPISYNRDRKSYFYEADVKVYLEVLICNEKIIKIKGGKKTNNLPTDIFWQY